MNNKMLLQVRFILKNKNPYYSYVNLIIVGFFYKIFIHICYNVLSNELISFISKCFSVCLYVYIYVCMNSTGRMKNCIIFSPMKRAASRARGQQPSFIENHKENQSLCHDQDLTN